MQRNKIKAMPWHFSLIGRQWEDTWSWWNSASPHLEMTVSLLCWHICRIHGLGLKFLSGLGELSLKSNTLLEALSALHKKEYLFSNLWSCFQYSDATTVLNRGVNSPKAEFNPNIALTAASQRFFSKAVIESAFAKVVIPHLYTHTCSHSHTHH